MSTPTVGSQQIAAAADAVVQRMSAGDDRVPGVVAGVTTDRETIYLGHSGSRALDEPAAMTDDTVFAIFSTTKAIAGTAALQLVERGELDLDAPAKEYDPRLGEVEVIEGFGDDGQPRLRAPESDITTRQLLTHTAGFGYDFFNEAYARLATEHGQPSIITASMASLRTPLLFDPGTRWEYGTNMDWAGLVVEGITGKRLGEVITERILNPLALSDTAFTRTDSMRQRSATMHHRGADGCLTPDHDFALPDDPEVHMGGHGLYSTVGDYLKFIRMWINDGRSDAGEQILRPETVELAERNHLPGDMKITALPGVIPSLSNDAEFFPGMPKSWALSFMINEEQAPTGRPAGSLAWAGLANLYYWIDRRNRIGGYWATQILPFADASAVVGYWISRPRCTTRWPADSLGVTSTTPGLAVGEEPRAGTSRSNLGPGPHRESRDPSDRVFRRTRRRQGEHSRSARDCCGAGGCPAGVQTPSMHTRVSVLGEPLTGDTPETRRQVCVDAQSVVWLERDGDERPNDAIILERLALATGIRLAGSAPELARRDVAVLLDRAAALDDRREAASRLGLVTGVQYRAVATPLFAEWTSRPSWPGDVVATPLGTIHALISPIKVTARTVPASPCGLGVGAGIDDLAESFRTALIALKLCERPERAVDAAQYGGLIHLLADVTSTATNPDTDRLEAVMDNGWGRSTIAALLDSSSARQAARTLNVHHSTMQSRIEHLSTALQFNPLDGLGRAAGCRVSHLANAPFPSARIAPP